jgi:CRISPR-associated protein Cas5t
VTDTLTALEVTITAPVASFRDPLYASGQIGLPCPPPSTVGGLLAAAAGGWDQMPTDTRFAMAFTARAAGSDLETYHPLDAQGRRTTPVPKERQFLFSTTLTLWLVEDIDWWRAVLRRPVWPLRLGRSQDVASARAHTVVLRDEPGQQGHALLPADASTAGQLLRLPTAISLDRARHQWDSYRYDPRGKAGPLSAGWSAPDGRAVLLLPPTHPVHVPAGVA